MSSGLDSLAILQQMMKRIPQDQRSDELQASMAHAERIVTNHVPYRGAIDMKFIQSLFETDETIMKHIRHQGLQDRLEIEFMYEMCPDEEFYKTRGKKDNETKQDIKERYGKVIREYIDSVIEK